jgi:uncharacterized protein (DUF302 family)
MGYFFSKTLQRSYEDTLSYVEEKLKDQGFGVITEVELHKKFKEKLNVDFRRYKILGACSPKHAYEAVSKEEHIGLMLPCNVVIQDKGENTTEVSVVDPVASMQAVENPGLADTAGKVREKLKEFFDTL